MDKQLSIVYSIVNRITLNCMGVELHVIAERDKIYGNGRIYLQITYAAPCTKTGEMDIWKGRKWYLSDYMTVDEIIKTAYAAFEQCVKHEIMEGFKVDGVILFNPHISYEKLLEVSHFETKRDEK